VAAIDDLIAQIEDKALRERLRLESDRILKEKKFGLVFESHLPELTPIYGAKVRKGYMVAHRGAPLTDLWRVLSISEGKAHCLNRLSGETKQIPVDKLVVVRQFGEPIFPALVRVDKVQNGPDGEPWHTLIEADNYHALQLLEYLYAGQVDCIYIDPPYNSGARDWKYNNDYVDKNDGWRHSKWLAFMGRRLRLAKKLLNPVDSTLIVAIDDNELFTLGLLLDDIFKGCDRQIVNITINPKGKARDGRLSQVDEYLLVIYLGEAKAQELSPESSEVEVRWPYLRRSDVESARGTKKGGVRQFYPIYVDKLTEQIVNIGEPLTPTQSLACAPDLEGAIAVFPIREDGKQMNWGLTSPSLNNAVSQGFVRVLRSKNKHQPYNFTYLTVPSIKKVEEGVYSVIGEREDGSKIVVIPSGKIQRGTTSWKKNLYDANAYGS
jgi:adenine-specific DNA-methyltransferase